MATKEPSTPLFRVGERLVLRARGFSHVVAVFVGYRPDGAVEVAFPQCGELHDEGRLTRVLTAEALEHALIRRAE